MKYLYSHANRLLVDNARNLVALAGIETTYRNEFAGGATGEVAPGDTWLELWLIDESRYEEALALIHRQASGADWVCVQCEEHNDPSFDYCWQCEHARDD